MALSGDGATALVGAGGTTVGDNESQGAIYVFTRSGGTWRQQSELTAGDGAQYDDLGSSVALSSDGATALVGADHKTMITWRGDGHGVTYVFARSSGTSSAWHQQSKLTAGFVALSGDGTAALVAAGGVGYMFSRSGSTWSRRSELPVGGPVALSADGATALAGDGNKKVGKNDKQGAASVFTRSGGTWSQQSELTDGDGAPSESFGSAVALSADGATILIGADGKNVDGHKDQGVAYVFTRVGGTWSSIPTSPVPAPPGNPTGDTYFPATHHSLRAPFLAFYTANGGLKIFGLPLTEAFTESGQLVQYFERSRLAVAQGHVVISPLGAQLTAGRKFPAAACCGSSGQTWFAATHHTLSGLFLTFWNTRHGALLFGPPISQPLYEQNGDGTGRTYLVQYFENARMEYHPELAATGNDVTLGQLGRQVLQQRGWISGRDRPVCRVLGARTRFLTIPWLYKVTSLCYMLFRGNPPMEQS